jgi:DNA-binding MarR family transcriptional regulator
MHVVIHAIEKMVNSGVLCSRLVNLDGLGRVNSTVHRKESVDVKSSRPLAFDPIEEARRQWIERGWGDVAEGMAAVTSVIRAQQIYLARIDAVLRPFDITFARFELLTLLSFTRTGSLPMNKVGARLQVHPTSVTSSVDRLETQGLVQRIPHPTDRRTTLVEILRPGRTLVAKATVDLNERVFAAPGISPVDARRLITILRRLRLDERDFDT